MFDFRVNARGGQQLWSVRSQQDYSDEPDVVLPSEATDSVVGPKESITFSGESRHSLFAGGCKQRAK